jgi:hypothetical protein
MGQIGFGASEYARNKHGRREVLLAEVKQAVVRPTLLALIALNQPEGGRGRWIFPLVAMLRVHLFFRHLRPSDLLMEGALGESAPIGRSGRLR